MTRPILVAALVGVAAFLAGCGGTVPASGPTGSAITTVASDFAGVADGTTPRADAGGSPYRDARTSNVTTAPAVRNGVLEGNLPDAGSARYLQQELPGDVVRIGAVFGFRQGPVANGGNGALCLAAWSRPIVDPTGPVPDAPFHLVVSPTQAGLSFRQGGVSSSDVLHVDFSPPLPMNGTPLTVEITTRDRVATVRMPDRSEHTVRLPGPEVAAPVASWEFFKFGRGDADVTLLRTWADAGEARR